MASLFGELNRIPNLALSRLQIGDLLAANEIDANKSKSKDVVPGYGQKFYYVFVGAPNSGHSWDSIQGAVDQALADGYTSWENAPTIYMVDKGSPWKGSGPSNDLVIPSFVHLIGLQDVFIDANITVKQLIPVDPLRPTIPYVIWQNIGFTNSDLTKPAVRFVDDPSNPTPASYTLVMNFVSVNSFAFVGSGAPLMQIESATAFIVWVNGGGFVLNDRLMVDLGAGAGMAIILSDFLAGRIVRIRDPGAFNTFFKFFWCNIQNLPAFFPDREHVIVEVTGTRPEGIVLRDNTVVCPRSPAGVQPFTWLKIDPAVLNQKVVTVQNYIDITPNTSTSYVYDVPNDPTVVIVKDDRSPVGAVTTITPGNYVACVVP